MKKKSVEMRALEMVIDKAFSELSCECDKCDKFISEKICCAKLKDHFLSLAKKEMDKEKK